MSDLELLEYAAKALQLHIKGHLKCDAGNLLYLWVGQELTKDKFIFNPLTDYDDALRLAEKLQMSIDIGYSRIAVTEVSVIKDCVRISAEEYHNDDPSAATCRAIVRAAAEIAKGQK